MNIQLHYCASCSFGILAQRRTNRRTPAKVSMICRAAPTKLARWCVDNINIHNSAYMKIQTYNSTSGYSLHIQTHYCASCSFGILAQRRASRRTPAKVSKIWRAAPTKLARWCVLKEWRSALQLQSFPISLQNKNKNKKPHPPLPTNPAYIRVEKRSQREARWG